MRDFTRGFKQEKWELCDSNCLANEKFWNERHLNKIKLKQVDRV